MEIKVSQAQGRVPVTVFHIEGDLAADTYDQLEAQAQQVIESGSRYLVLDLSKVPYVSSYGIRGISRIFTWLRSNSDTEDPASFSNGVRDGSYKSQHLKLANPSKQVENALKISGIDMLIDIHSDLNKAIASF